MGAAQPLTAPALDGMSMAVKHGGVTMWWLVLAAAAAFGGGYLMWRHPGPASTQPSMMTDSTVPSTLAAGDGGMLSPVPPSPSKVVVYVVGAVKRPGVYELAPGSRVVDALAKAGGADASADVSLINLAEPAIDAMKIVVPKMGARDAGAVDSERLTLVDRPKSTSRERSARRGLASTSARGGSHKLQPGQTVNINTASEAELDALPGVGPGLARRIVEYRRQNGPFQSVDDLQNVPGIGPSKFDRLQQFVRL